MDESSSTGIAVWDAEIRKRRQYVDQKHGLTVLSRELANSSEMSDIRLLLLVSCVQVLQEKVEELERKAKIKT